MAKKTTQYYVIDGVFSVLIGQYQHFKKGGLMYVFVQFPAIQNLDDYKSYKKEIEHNKSHDLSHKTKGMRRLRITKEELELKKEVTKIYDNTKRSGLVSKWGSGE